MRRVSWTGDGSGYQIAQTQPMKLAAVEGLYEGGTNVGLVGIGIDYFGTGRSQSQSLP